MPFKSKHLNIILLVLVIFAPFIASATVLEVGIPGQVEAGKALPGLTDYMKYVYWFMLGAVGIAAFVSLVWYGVMWIYSGIVEKKSEALEGIKNTFIGLLLAFGAYIILNTINPDIVSFREPAAPQPQVMSDEDKKTTVLLPGAPVKAPTLLSGLAADISASFVNFTQDWPQCSALFKGTATPILISPEYTLSQVKDPITNGFITACRTGCSNIEDPINRYCTATVPISPAMMQAIWNATHIISDQPAFSIIEITGGDRPDNPNTRMHYTGRAIDVRPKAGTSGNDYKKVISAFSGSGPSKIVCVNQLESFENPTCNEAWGIDHLHIEW